MARVAERKISQISAEPSSSSSVSFCNDIILQDGPRCDNSLMPKDETIPAGTKRPKSNISSAFTKQHAGFGLVNFFTLKVLFFDVFITLGDVISDFAQAIALYSSTSEKVSFFYHTMKVFAYHLRGKKNISHNIRKFCHQTLTGETWVYGLVSMVVIWLPGTVCAIHIISMYRYKWSAKRTIMYACKLRWDGLGLPYRRKVQNSIPHLDKITFHFHFSAVHTFLPYHSCYSLHLHVVEESQRSFNTISLQCQQQKEQQSFSVAKCSNRFVQFSM